MAKRKTEYTRQRYLKERRRVQNLVYKLRNRGYYLNPTDVLHAIPKKNFASATKRLEEIRSQMDLANKYLGTDTIKPPRPRDTSRPVDLPAWYDKEYWTLRVQIAENLHDVPAKFLNQYINMAEKVVGREKLMESIKYLEDEEGVKVTYEMNYKPALFQRYLWEVTRNLDMTRSQYEKVWDEYETLIGEYQEAMGGYDDEDY